MIHPAALTDDQLDNTDNPQNIPQDLIDSINELVRPENRRIADAQLRKALWWIVDWMQSDDIALSDDRELFAYGGPASCEYGCLPGTSVKLENLLNEAGIEKWG